MSPLVYIFLVTTQFDKRLGMCIVVKVDKFHNDTTNPNLYSHCPETLIDLMVRLVIGHTYRNGLLQGPWEISCRSFIDLGKLAETLLTLFLGVFFLENKIIGFKFKFQWDLYQGFPLPTNNINLDNCRRQTITWPIMTQAVDTYMRH